MRFIQIALVLIVGLGTTASYADDGTISGTVTSVATSEGLPGAVVTIVGTRRGASANVDGEYSFMMTPGTYTARASFVGYGTVEKSVTVSSGGSVTLDFQLSETGIIGDELVVIGARTPRTATQTPVPIDIISSQTIREYGFTEVNQILAVLAPSFNASHQTISDGTDHINPASLRGLGPDQVLVLVNGKRRHTSALVHVNGTFGRGTVGVDLNSIPTAAIERIEVLRDGAASQYGSDAIAGVINIVLKDQADRVEINATAGVNDLGGKEDGETVQTDINYGFQIGEGGFFNVTGEYINRGRTDRSGVYTGPIFTSDGHETGSDAAELANRGLTARDFSMKTGQGKATFGTAFFNTAIPTGASAEFYAFGGISHRNGEATGFYRLPYQEERVVFDIYPNGFLPEIHTEVQDISASAGLRGTHGKWDVDLSVTHGSNGFQYNIENTNNASIGSASPITFDAGRLGFAQTTGNIDIVRPLNTTWKSLSLVLGGEFRVEQYRIDAGEDASWQLGNGGGIPGVDFDTTSSGAPKNPGSQVFAGFQPENEVNRFRNSISMYAGFESQISDAFLVDIGGRFENYSDFGSTATGKLALRWEVVDQFALRGAVSNGFRAPSLHQAWFNNVSIQFVLDDSTGQLEPSRVLTAHNQSSVTKAFGIPDLKEETSVNFSGGFTWTPLDNLSLTADFYHITINDRIVLSSRFSASADPRIADLLEPFASAGVNAAQFFTNAVDTRTQGVDVVAAWRTDLGSGRLTLTGSANFTETTVQEIKSSSSLLIGFEDLIFNREEQNRLETALPRQKGTLSARFDINRLSVSARANHYGSVEYRPTAEANDETFGAKTLFDLEVLYRFLDELSLTVGAVNILNTFPDEHQLPGNRSFERFIYSRRVTQFGMNGGYYWTRLSLNL